MNTDINVFPLPIYAHLVFVCLAFILFVFQYSRQKKPYQILMAIAIPATLLLHINSSKTWYNMIGILEVVLIILSFVTVIVSKIRNRAAKKAGEGGADGNAEATEEESAHSEETTAE